MENPQKAYYIITAMVNDFQKLKMYGDKATPLMKKYDGRVIISDKNAEHLEGERYGNLHVVIEFHSKEKALGWYNNDEYAEAKKIRFAASNTIHLF